jgi:hypothetical protein
MNEEQNVLAIAPSPQASQRERVELIAHALAYGADNNMWPPKIRLIYQSWEEAWLTTGHPKDGAALKSYLKSIWANKPPQMAYLEAFGYVQESGKTDHLIAFNAIVPATEYLLTPKAFALLEKPVTPPSVFISYRRDESSALSLLIVARLQAKGIQNPFIDMNIEPGEKWHAELEAVVKSSRYFISVLGKNPFASEWVVKEIQWASETPNLIYIPVWHNRYSPKRTKTLDAGLAAYVGSIQAIRVKEESAEGYHGAMTHLLNRLGYAP